MKPQSQRLRNQQLGVRLVVTNLAIRDFMRRLVGFRFPNQAKHQQTHFFARDRSQPLI